MKSLLLFLFFSINFCAFCQVKPIYFIGDVIVKDSTTATSYGIYGKLSNENLWVLKTYDLYDNLLHTGTFKDEKFQIPHGEFIYYNDIYKFNEDNMTDFNIINGKNRFIAGRGRFENGVQVGRWITFFPNGKFKTIVTFVKGIKNGPFSQYNRRGKVEIAGNYLMNEKNGDWVYNNGRKKEIYVEGRLIENAKKNIK